MIALWLQPKAQKKKHDASNALKDYACKLDKRSGHLYLSDGDGIWFQHKLLGLVTKVCAHCAGQHLWEFVANSWLVGIDCLPD
jgi:hypothetical protein